MTSRGNGYLGSSTIQTSVANKEIVPIAQAGWTQGYKLRKFSFNNEQDCRIVINGNVTLFLKAEQGFEMGQDDLPITSFKIVESAIKYNWIATF